MTDKSAIIAGTFSDLKTVKTRSVVQLVIEVPIERAEEVIRAFGFPQPGREIPVAVARLVEEPAPVAQRIEHRNSTPNAAGSNPAGGSKSKRAWSDLSYAEQAGIRCAEPAFWKFLSDETHCDRIESDIEAARFVRFWCGVKSRSELLRSNSHGKTWHDLDLKYGNWLGGVSPDELGRQRAA